MTNRLGTGHEEHLTLNCFLKLAVLHPSVLQMLTLEYIYTFFLQHVFKLSGNKMSVASITCLTTLTFFPSVSSSSIFVDELSRFVTDIILPTDVIHVPLNPRYRNVNCPYSCRTSKFNITIRNPILSRLLLLALDIFIHIRRTPTFIQPVHCGRFHRFQPLAHVRTQISCSSSSSDSIFPSADDDGDGDCNGDCDCACLLRGISGGIEID